MKQLAILVGISAFALAGCGQWAQPPRSVGDVNAGYQYVPVEPLPVSFGSLAKCATPDRPNPVLLDALHDLATRVATQQISGEATVRVPIFSAGGGGSTYKVTQDFIAYDETSLRFAIPPEFARGELNGAPPPRLTLLEPNERAPENMSEITVPVYVGVGIRLTATVNVLRGNVNIADLGALSAAAKAERVDGKLVAQTLGLSGTKLTTILPLQGELNTTTIQNATVAIGSIKALLYDKETHPWPRVVGIHYPFEKVDQGMVNAIVSALAVRGIQWVPCETGPSSLRAV